MDQKQEKVGFLDMTGLPFMLTYNILRLVPGLNWKQAFYAAHCLAPVDQRPFRFDKEVANFLGVSDRTPRNWAKEGTVLFEILFSGRVLVANPQIIWELAERNYLTWLEEQRQKQLAKQAEGN